MNLTPLDFAHLIFPVVSFHSLKMVGGRSRRIVTVLAISACVVALTTAPGEGAPYVLHLAPFSKKPTSDRVSVLAFSERCGFRPRILVWRSDCASSSTLIFESLSFVEKLNFSFRSRTSIALLRSAPLMCYDIM